MGAPCAIAGSVWLCIGTLLPPMSAAPNEVTAACTAYATLPTPLHALMRGTIIVPAAHDLCRAVCRLFIVIARASRTGKDGGRRAAVLTTIAEPMSQGPVPGSECV